MSKREYYTNNNGAENTLYLSVYKSICIDNVDKQIPNSGRIQVFVPEIHGMRLAQVFKGRSNIQYKFPGANITDLTADVLEYLKSLCPWAVLCMPITGGAGPGLYNAKTGQASVTENPCVKINQGEDPDRNPTTGSHLELANRRQTDPHASPSLNFVAKSNVGGAEMAGIGFSNCPKGTFAIPRVGCTLLVSFFKGDPNFPVALGVLPSSDDFRSIYEQDGGFPGYPAGYESNVPSPPGNTPPPSKAETDAVKATTGGTPTDADGSTGTPDESSFENAETELGTPIGQSEAPVDTRPLQVAGNDPQDELPDLTKFDLPPASNLTPDNQRNTNALLPDESFTPTRNTTGTVAKANAAAALLPTPTSSFSPSTTQKEFIGRGQTSITRRTPGSIRTPTKGDLEGELPSSNTK